MKKQLTLMALAFGITGAMAQDLTSKKGEQYLPEAKDWCVGIDADPFLNYAGNFFGKSSNNTAPSFHFLNSNQTLIGKYFTDDKTAYRVGLRIGFGGNTLRNNVTDRAFQSTYSASVTPNNYPTIFPQKENVWKHSSTNIGLSAGIEKRRGKTRLQGYYGGEAGIGITSSKDKFTYGNKLIPKTSATTSVDPVVNVDATADLIPNANNIISLNTSGSPTGRLLERKNGTTFALGVRGFVGVEYFILPKISLGGEFGWGLAISVTGKSTSKYESVGNDGTAPKDNTVGNSTVTGTKSGTWQVDTENLNSIFGPIAVLRLNFHF